MDISELPLVPRENLIQEVVKGIEDSTNSPDNILNLMMVDGNENFTTRNE
jgi:hypothetical protein